MALLQQDSLPCVTKLLTERLRVEKESLELFEKNLSSEDIFARKQAEGNIQSNKGRIKQLEEALAYLKTYKPIAH